MRTIYRLFFYENCIFAHRKLHFLQKLYLCAQSTVFFTSTVLLCIFYGLLLREFYRCAQSTAFLRELDFFAHCTVLFTGIVSLRTVNCLFTIIIFVRNLLSFDGICPASSVSGPLPVCIIADFLHLFTHLSCPVRFMNFTLFIIVPQVTLPSSPYPICFSLLLRSLSLRYIYASGLPASQCLQFRSSLWGRERCCSPIT